MMLGIDVSKADLTGTFLAAADQPRWTMTVPNTPEGVRWLLQRTPLASPWVVEPTGQFSALVVRQAQEADRTVLLAPTKQAKAFLSALSPRAKTDRVDSHGLARYALAVALRPFPVKSAVVEQVEQLLAARKGLVQSRMRLRQQRAALPAAAEPLRAAIAALSKQIVALDKQLAEQMRQDELGAAQRLTAIPGVGAVTATTVAACLSSKRFAHPDHFVAYCGLDVQVRDSGQLHGRRRLSKQGDAELRRLFYCCAQATLRRRDPDNPFHQQYERERAKGLPTTAALCVVARKLARTCWSLVTHGATYDPERVHRQPPSQTATPPVTLDNEP